MHENVKQAMLLIENFIDEYGDHLPPVINIEVTNDTAEVHVNLTTVAQLTSVHDGLDRPVWSVTGTDTAAYSTVGQIRVTIYYSALRDEPAAQAPLRAMGVLKGLALVEGGR